MMKRGAFSRRVLWVAGVAVVAAVSFFLVDGYRRSVVTSPRSSSVRSTVPRVAPPPAIVLPATVRELPQQMVDKAVASTESVGEKGNAERATLDREHVAVIIGNEYATDAAPTRASLERERAIGKLFADSAIQEKGRLVDIDCRQRICRGVIEFKDAGVINSVIRKTLRSSEYIQNVSEAWTLASRQETPGGILGTFYIHPQGIVESVLSAGAEREVGLK